MLLCESLSENSLNNIITKTANIEQILYFNEK